MDPTAIIRWGKNIESDMHHYSLYNSGEDTTKIMDILHPDTSVTVNITPFVVYYYDSVFFYVTASDTANNESEKSDIVGRIFPKYNNTLYGDVDGSGKVDVEDRSIITGLVGSIITNNSPIKVMRCDLDASRKIDINDVAFMDENLGATQTVSVKDDSSIHNIRFKSVEIRRRESRDPDVRNK
jgi:hypothetical protein